MKTTKLNIGGIAISIENNDPTSTSNKSPVLAKSSEEYLICATEAITLANVTAAVLQDMNNDNSMSMSREGFGEKAKAIAKKTIDAIISFFKKIIEWCDNLIGFISQKIKSKLYEVEMNRIFKSLTREEWDAGVAELKGRNIKLEGFVIDEQERKNIFNELKRLLGLVGKVSDSWKSDAINKHVVNEILDGGRFFKKFKQNWEMATKDAKKWESYMPVNDILKNIRYGDTSIFNAEYEQLKYLGNVLADMNEMSKKTNDNVIEIQKNRMKDVKSEYIFLHTHFNQVFEILKEQVCPAINFMSSVVNELFKQEFLVINNKLKAAKMVVAVVKEGKDIGKESILSNIDSVWDNL